MLPHSPASMITAIAVFGTFWLVSNCASRTSAHALGPYVVPPYGAIWTKRNGKSPSPQVLRQDWIMVGNNVRYSYARPALDSPWYQIAPRIANGCKGAIIALYKA